MVSFQSHTPCSDLGSALPRIAGRGRVFPPDGQTLVAVWIELRLSLDAIATPAELQICKALSTSNPSLLISAIQTQKAWRVWKNATEFMEAFLVFCCV